MFKRQQIFSMMPVCVLFIFLLGGCSEGQLRMMLQGMRAEAIHVSLEEQNAIKNTYAAIREGEPINHQDAAGQTQLHRASLRGYDYLVGLLIFQGFDLDARDVDGNTSLHLAAQQAHLAVVNTLLNNDADPLIVNQAGQTALDLLIQEGRQDTRSLSVQNTLIDFMERWQVPDTK